MVLTFLEERDGERTGGRPGAPIREGRDGEEAVADLADEPSEADAGQAVAHEGDGEADRARRPGGVEEHVALHLLPAR